MNEVKKADNINIEEIFGENVFNLGTMKKWLPEEAYFEVEKVSEHGGELSKKTADIVAKSMKDWAVSKGATHYTHWFQPLTGTTAEKHDILIAFTSQMPHLVSNAFIKSPSAESHKGFSAGSYKDMTRVAWLNPVMWAELFMENKDNLIFEVYQKNKTYRLILLFRFAFPYSF